EHCSRTISGKNGLPSTQSVPCLTYACGKPLGPGVVTSSAACTRWPPAVTLVTSTSYGVEEERPESVTEWLRARRWSLRQIVGGDPGGPTATWAVVADP